MAAPRRDDFCLQLADFAALREFAPAGLQATILALERARGALELGRIPIAGAAVHQSAAGQLTTVTVGNNGRIAAPDDTGKGYPTDHGETAAIRAITDFEACDWPRIVFATTLSPCIMCSRSLGHLHGRGLDKVVVAESQTYPGAADVLAALPGMQVLGLTNPAAVRMMQTFARRYPWDWAADIGAVPPRGLAVADRLAADPGLQARHIASVTALVDGELDFAAGVVGPDGDLLAARADERRTRGGNPTYSAPMQALGMAGSAVNPRECALVFVAGSAIRTIDIAAFGESSTGACELFRPAAMLSNAPFESGLRKLLADTGIRMLVPEVSP